jgi:ABC-type antimicrobial peptide transport system permease subunit
MALGVTRGGVIAMVLRGAGALVGAGIVTGLPLALLGIRLAGRVLPDAQPAAVESIATAAILVTLVAFFATTLPSIGAARIDPVTALRGE